MALPEFPPRACQESGLARRVSRVSPASTQIKAGMCCFARIALARDGLYGVGALGKYDIADSKNQGKPGRGSLDSLVPRTAMSLTHS